MMNTNPPSRLCQAPIEMEIFGILQEPEANFKEWDKYLQGRKSVRCRLKTSRRSFMMNLVVDPIKFPRSRPRLYRINRDTAKRSKPSSLLEVPTAQRRKFMFLKALSNAQSESSHLLLHISIFI